MQDKYLNSDYHKSTRLIESLINNPGPNFLKADSKKDRSFFIKRLKYLLKSLNNPEKNFKYIHIAGTSGKSSLACMLQSILTASGLTTGAYFSPHPTYTTERIKTGNNYISQTDFSNLTEKLKPHLSKCAKNSPYGIPSYFETLLALALLYFKKQKCKYVILEAGLGGSFDATNIIPKPELAIITNINLDHTDILGNTKQKIARDKAGIIKKGTTLITAEQDPKILKIFTKICKQKNAKFQPLKLNHKILKNNLTDTEFEYQGKVYETKLHGEHQVRNAILAIEAIKQPFDAAQGLRKNTKTQKQQCNNETMKQWIKKGLTRAFIPCRLETIRYNPTIILDGAHNPDKMKSTANFIKNLKPKNNLHLILSLAENKDLYNTLKYIVPLAHHVYLTRFLIPGRKAHDLKKMYQCAKRLTNCKISTHIDPYQALSQSLHQAKKNDIVLITGSFFLAGELRKRWMTKKTHFSSN